MWRVSLADSSDRSFDNVGGGILDDMLTMIKRHFVITVRGAIPGQFSASTDVVRPRWN